MFSPVRFATLATLVLCCACSSNAPAPEKAKAVPASASTQKPEAKDFSIEGFYSEACSCSAPCPCSG